MQQTDTHTHTDRRRFHEIHYQILQCLFEHKLTALSRVLLEKLIVTQLDKKFPAFYGTERFITVFTTAHHMPLS